MAKAPASSTSNEILIGQLISKVDILLENEKQASVSRREIYAELEANRAALKDVADRMGSVENEMGPIKAFKAKADRWEQRGVGAVALAGMLATAIGSIIGANILYIKRFLGFQ
jgi:hypothetical protein